MVFNPHNLETIVNHNYEKSINLCEIRPLTELDKTQ